MSGHSKWHQIRRQKGVTDAKRGQLFTRLGREIVVAVREGGGGDPDGNARLRLAIQRARAANMPLDNIDRTIKRAMGGGEGIQLDEIRYEGYAPGGAAIMVQVMTDNRNRAAAEIRNVFSKNGGNLGEVGCVDWIFEPRGVIEVKLAGKNLDDLMMAALDAGAEDVPTPAPGDETATVYTDYNGVEDVREKLATAGYEIENSEATLVPKTKVPLSEKDGVAALRLMDKIEDLEDVQAVYTNAEISDEIAEKYAS